MARKKFNGNESTREIVKFLYKDMSYLRNRVDKIHNVLLNGEGKIAANREAIKGNFNVLDNHLKDHRGEKFKTIGGAGGFAGVILIVFKILEKVGLL